MSKDPQSTDSKDLSGIDLAQYEVFGDPEWIPTEGVLPDPTKTYLRKGIAAPPTDGTAKDGDIVISILKPGDNFSLTEYTRWVLAVSSILERAYVDPLGIDETTLPGHVLLRINIRKEQQ